jgi:hypothetical protein
MTQTLPNQVLRIFSLVAERLPKHELAIRRLIATDLTFRELCGEFAEALEAQSIRQGRKGTPNPAIESDWQEILDSLTGEILTHINDDQGRKWQR